VSRIGKMPIELPKGVSVDVDRGNYVTVKGPKGQLEQQLPPDIIFEVNDGEVLVKRPSDSPEHRAFHGMSRALLYNMVQGVSNGFTRVLDIEGVGYRSGIIGKNLVLLLGYSHPVEVVPPPGISFEVDKTGRQITISGIDKQQVGQMAAEIRSIRSPEPYKGKGVRYQGEIVRLKAGKSGKVGGKK
jgi:large subunit ribosomal protein L6